MATAETPTTDQPTASVPEGIRSAAPQGMQQTPSAEPAPPPKEVYKPLVFVVDFIDEFRGYSVNFTRGGNPCEFKDVGISTQYPDYDTWTLNVRDLWARDCTAKVTITGRDGKQVTVEGVTAQGGKYYQVITFKQPIEKVLGATIRVDLACSDPVR